MDSILQLVDKMVISKNEMIIFFMKKVILEENSEKELII